MAWTGNEACSDNYPAVREWLREHVFAAGGQCVSQDFGPRKSYAIERYAVGGRIVVLVLHSGRRGWEAYVPVTDPSTSGTIEALNAALGITTGEG